MVTIAKAGSMVLLTLRASNNSLAIVITLVTHTGFSPAPLPLALLVRIFQIHSGLA
jgi:hypothetical protein